MSQQFEFHLHIVGPEGERDFVIPQGETLIGRDPSCALPLVYPMVSRRHALLHCSEAGCTLTDLESANGTLLNGVRLNPLEPARLTDQARITIGPFEMVFSQSPLAIAEPASPVEEPAPVEIEPQVKEEPLPAAEAPPEKKKPARQSARPAKAAPAAQKETPEPEAPVGAPPPAQPPSDGRDQELADLPPWQRPIPGLTLESQRLIQYLPGIYDTNFMRRFLGLFESILTPLEWTVDNFDLYLDPGTSPLTFLPWLAGWYEIVFDPSWTETQRRTLLKEAHQIYARRGTRWALSRLLEIYTGSIPEIIEFSDPSDPFTFIIKLPIREQSVNRQLLEQLIDANKPAHTSYNLEFRK